MSRSLAVCVLQPLGYSSILVGLVRESARLFRGLGIHRKVQATADQVSQRRMQAGSKFSTHSSPSSLILRFFKYGGSKFRSIYQYVEIHKNFSIRVHHLKFIDRNQGASCPTEAGEQGDLLLSEKRSIFNSDLKKFKNHLWNLCPHALVKRITFRTLFNCEVH